MAHQFVAIAIEELWRDDDVTDAGFVFEGQKHKTFRSTGTLAHNHPTRHAHEVAVAELANIDRAQGFQAIQFLPVISYRVLADRQAGAAKISVDAFGDGHRLEW